MWHLHRSFFQIIQTVFFCLFFFFYKFYPGISRTLGLFWISKMMVIMVFFSTLQHCCQSCAKRVDLSELYVPLTVSKKHLFSVHRPPFRIVYLCLHFKLNILVFYLLLFCLKVYERWNSWTTSVHFYMALHLFLYVFFLFF